MIAIDPKGDLGNLLLTFPSLRAEGFLPWIDQADAARHGRTADEHAQWTADLWRAGLTRWGQKPARISAFGSRQRTDHLHARESHRGAPERPGLVRTTTAGRPG